MAEQGVEYHHGDMDIHEHVQTFEGFIKLAKWGSLYIAALILLLTLWFCTAAGFLGALVATVVVVAIGVLALSEKHKL